jgi:probable F420-dependent oxidoreductase
MRFGLGVGGDLASVEEGAHRAEELGFESVWVAETARSAFVQAAMAARATSRALIGTNIALAFPRSPALTAMEARDVAELSGGRFVLGLGAQVKGVMERRFGVPYEHPAPKLAEAVEAIRAVWGAFGGGPIDHRGRFYRITMAPFPGAGPAPTPIPVHLAAVNERMAETAGRVADGVLGHPMTSPEYVRDVLRPAVERGREVGGRGETPFEVTTSLIVQVSDDDPHRARREAALQLGFYATTRTYRPVLALHGFDGLVEPLRRAFAAGDLAALAEIALPMVDTLAVAGSAEECRTRVAAFEGLVDRVILSGAWVGPDQAAVAENARAVTEAFAPLQG